MKHTLLVLILVISCLTISAQDQELQQLKKRVDSLEKKLSVRDSIYKKRVTNELPNSRNEIENNSYTGFVISSIKGVSLSIGGFVETDLIYDFKATEQQCHGCGMPTSRLKTGEPGNTGAISWTTIIIRIFSILRDRMDPCRSGRYKSGTLLTLGNPIKWLFLLKCPR